jgi:leader peptidase (prepilin peptidase)/N-methyltransferase
MLLFFFYLLTGIFGLLLGNYGTTLLYRLPRSIELSGLTKNNQPPFCSFCNHPLKYYEALPLLSWICTRFKCNYCGVKVPINYFLLEFSTALASLYLFYKFGFSDYYIIFLPFFALTVLSSFLYLENFVIPSQIHLALLVLALFYRLLLEKTLIPVLLNLASFFILYLLIIKKKPSWQRPETFYFALQSLALIGKPALLLIPITLIKNPYSFLIAYLAEIIIFLIII